MRLINLLKKYFRNIALIINIICAILLVFSYLAPFTNPIQFTGFAFLGLIYSFLLIVNIFYILFWIFLKSKLFLVSTVSILIGWNFLTNFIQISFSDSENKSGHQRIHLLSYNVRDFNLWKWSSEQNRGIQTFDYIRKNRANIVCLQEFYSSNIKGKNAKDSLLQNSILKYAHISYTVKNKKTSNYGIATFSSFPIIAEGSVKIKENDNFCIYSDILIGADTIRFYNLHLESIHLGYDDYQLIENINSTDTIDVTGIKSILLKLKKSYQKRALQSITIASHLKKCKYAIILCGDFNDTPISFVYNQLTLKLLDSFCETGNGIGSTYINKYSTFRIDYILHSPELKVFNFSTPHVELSDHYPVQCQIQVYM